LRDGPFSVTLANVPLAKGNPMKRYTLNDRGRMIWIYIPTIILVVLFTATDILEVLVTWIFG
jgi:hypothetical protein